MNRRIYNLLINGIAAKTPQRIRDLVFSLTGFCKSSVQIRQRCYFQTPKTITFGNNIFINKDCKFYNGYGNEESGIKICDNVTIGFNNTFITTSHDIGPAEHRADYKNFYGGEITIEKGVWITSNCTVLPGVTIGKGCVIAAGSVVTKNCTENGLYAGVPACRVKDL